MAPPRIKEVDPLVLSRKQQESINIGADVIVRIGRLSQNRVQLVIDAPQNIRVVRCKSAPATARCGKRVNGDH